MALYTYDSEADALYVLLASEPEPPIARTVEAAPNLHVDLDEHDHAIGVEVLYPRTVGIDLLP